MHNLVHFMLAAALVTIQGATADWSKAQSEGAGDSQCIKSLDELISAFKRRETITGNHTTLLDDWHSIFDMELQYLLAYNMMFLTYQVSFPGNTTGYRCPEGASACCTPVDNGGHSPLQTHTVILYQSEIFGIFPTPLIILGTPLSVVLATSYQRSDLGVREYCWSPPAFCSGLLQIKGILRSFSIAVSCNIRRQTGGYICTYTVAQCGLSMQYNGSKYWKLLRQVAKVNTIDPLARRLKSYLSKSNWCNNFQ